MRNDLPVWRSLMFVPVTAEKFVRTGADRGADATILDLEDAVAPSMKEHARTLIAGAITQVSRNGADVLVRINRPWRLAVRDLEAAVVPGVAALMLTKVDSAEHVWAIEEIVAELERERGLPAGGIKFVALVENANGFFRMEAIAKSSPRLVAISLGAEDFAADVGMLSEPEGLFYPKQHTIFAARAAGILPLGFIGSRGVSRHRPAVAAAGVHVRQCRAPAASGGAERGIFAQSGRGGEGGADDRRVRGGVCARAWRGAVRGRDDRCPGGGAGAVGGAAGGGVAGAVGNVMAWRRP